MHALKKEHSNPLRRTHHSEASVPVRNVSGKEWDIDGVRCYMDADGLAWFNAEDVAKGWGIVSSEYKALPAADGEEVSIAKNYISVRWNVLNSYLRGFGLKQDVKRGDYIPEDMAYRLGFRVNNPQARAFQEILASRILPSLRRQKTGSPVKATASDGMAALFLQAGETLAEMSRLFGEMAKAHEKNTKLSNELLADVQGLLDQKDQTKDALFRISATSQNLLGNPEEMVSRMEDIESRLEKMEKRPAFNVELLPEVARTDPANYDEKAVSLSQAASKMGLYSRNGKPHYQLISAILQKIGFNLKKGVTADNEKYIEFRFGQDYLTGKYFNMVYVKPAGMERLREFWEKERATIASRKYYSDRGERKGALKEVSYAFGTRNFQAFDASGAPIE